ncbi:Hypothetical predicted protein [Mytilus galloprovincialis]|uniref:Ig-like domain-containing protein n=1 Tax=Mytilus galloprovincialis TaxID=29158 RepID=A0A8B6BF16_MYTGA|nr:Hypothetical predicted protein [Mytilus galloprovincialis]
MKSYERLSTTIPNPPTLNGAQTLLLGTTYQWACISTGGNPSPIMTLRIGNSQFSTGITQTSVLQSDKTYTVTSTLSWAPSISKNGQTLYCDVKHQETRGNNLQTVSLQLTVNVLSGVPAVTTPTTDYKVNVGDPLTMTCTVTAHPQHTIVYWKYIEGGSSTNVNIGGRFSGSSVSSPSLILSNVQLSDQGRYVCYATNSVGTGHSTNVELAVTGNVPDVAITQPSQGSSGQAITIQCSYISNPEASHVKWSKGNQGITVDDYKYVGGSLSNPSLTITNLADSDQGPYRCSVVNSVGQGDSPYVTISVDTSTAPSYIRIVPACVVVNEGESFTLTCEADGDPVPTYNWYHNDVIIHEGAILTITNSLWTEHDGLILCKATKT